MKEKGGNKEKELSDMCSDVMTALKYDFWGALNFMPQKEGFDSLVQEPANGLDWDSIMMYGSRQGGKRQFRGHGKKDTVMTVNEGVGGPSRIKEVYERPPSEQDIEAVNRMYE